MNLMAGGERQGKGKGKERGREGNNVREWRRGERKGGRGREVK